MAKEGSTISGLMDAFATSISMALQYGVPLEALVEKFSTSGSSRPASPRTRDPLREEHHGLHLPVAGLEVPVRRAPGGGGVQHSETSLKPHSGPVTPVSVGVGPGPRGAGRRDAGAVGRSALPLLRQHHDPQRLLLPLRQLRVHQRLQLNPSPVESFSLPFGQGRRRFEVRDSRQEEVHGAQSRRRGVGPARRRARVRGGGEGSHGTVKVVTGGTFVVTDSAAKDWTFGVDSKETLVVAKGGRHKMDKLKADGKAPVIGEFHLREGHGGGHVCREGRQDDRQGSARQEVDGRPFQRGGGRARSGGPRRPPG